MNYNMVFLPTLPIFLSLFLLCYLENHAPPPLFLLGYLERDAPPSPKFPSNSCTYGPPLPLENKPLF
jgi:hypothetical protein